MFLLIHPIPVAGKKKRVGVERMNMFESSWPVEVFK